MAEAQRSVRPGVGAGLVQRHRVTVLVVPPPIMALPARHAAIDRYDLSSLGLIVSGGAPLQRAVAERLPHAGEPGELWARGPQIMAGYRARPDTTAAIITPDGWLRTGDLGRVDADGNVFVLDRLKGLIKVNALQVAPAEALERSRPDGRTVYVAEGSMLRGFARNSRTDGSRGRRARVRRDLEDHVELAADLGVGQRDPRAGPFEEQVYVRAPDA